MELSSILLILLGLGISIGVPVGLTVGVIVFLFTAVRSFSSRARSRRAAMIIAVATTVACASFVANTIYEVYQPVINKDKAATNGIILLFGPVFMSVYALVPASAVGGLLMFWSWVLKRNENAT